METQLQRLFQILRWCGATMIIAAAGTFLVQSWDQVGDVTRYLALLGMTVLLPAVAYVCGIRWQEGRSARVLMLTLLALLPIHAGVLGGFVFSQFGHVTTSITPVAQWIAPSRAAALLLVAGAGVALVPLTWSSFRALARPHAGLLVAGSAGGHALLLIPDRSALAATIAIVTIVGLTTWIALRTKPRTLEAGLAVSSLAAPAVVIAARQVLFYDVSAAFWSAIFSTAALVFFALGKQGKDVSLERLSVVPTLLATGNFVELFGDRVHLPLSSYWLLYGIISAVALLGFAWQSSTCKIFFVRAAVILNAVTATTTLLLDPGPWAALQAMVIGLGLLSYGLVTGRRGALYSGVALAAFGFIIEVVHAIEVFQPSGWLALAGFGFALVGLTAWLERRAKSAKLSHAAAQGLPQ